MAGVPINTVKEMVGHSSINTTLKYAHLAPNHAGEMLKKHPYWPLMLTYQDTLLNNYEFWEGFFFLL